MPDWTNVEILCAVAATPEQIVLVSSIPLSTAQEYFRQMFETGVPSGIKQMELRTSARGTSQEALILCTTPESATNALQLDGLVLGGNRLSVKPYTQARNGDHEKGREHSKYAEYIASGIITAQNLNAKYQLKEKATNVAQTVQSLDHKYGVSAKAEQVATYFNLWARVNHAVDVGIHYGNHALETNLGKRVQSTYASVVGNVTEVARDTQEILEEQKRLAAAAEIGMEPIDGEELEDEAIDLS
ncbi:hypothetical protein HDV00_004332 [Rhizophlyctis rosea]|nr:hypothetical protein HDV00_004332 [Rhizophlyctis rosea]